MSSSKMYTNPAARSWTYQYETDIQLAQDFHKRLPGYRPSPLVPLPAVAKELGVKNVFVKDESNRLGLPAFKILGASWGTFRAIAEQTGLSLDSSLETIAEAARKANTTLFAATEGNHGRAVARMGKLLGVPTRILMSRFADEETVKKIEGEGAHVVVIAGDYDAAVAKASEEANNASGGLLIQDNAFEGYEQIPAWIVEGYSTLLVEAEQQLAAQGLKATAMVTPIGVGSLGHAVVAHCKSDGREVAVVTVEPETAACLHQNLKAGKWTTIETSATIMNGMNCGTVSPISWSVFQNGVDASVTVSDLECHHAVQYLHANGVNAGPCGGASLAALRKVLTPDDTSLDLGVDAVLVLLSTEGARGYIVP
ncbi:tryptophan synthase beta subunit-like PLP-dependent enzyme [Exophiala viscosa]|uniref:tryptophan synthase beta subunit-like PLP-dependent enzyme n=1 Tax=Exophiala viscosa TaxID=2486360 RepID=UPI00219CE18E|nr:tryptophan synthase beta subunit-like PLP-dependent enzyme [Exophiala viscosa]